LGHELAGFAVNELDGGGGIRVQFEILPRDFQCPRRRIDGDDPHGAARNRRERESALVAESVEHPRTGRDAAGNRAVVALIQEIAGFLSVLEIYLYFN